MITASINLSKINKDHLYTNKKGEKILDVVLKEKVSDYGDDGFVAQSVSKKDREAGKKGEILGNYKVFNPPPGAAPWEKKPEPKDEDPFE